MLLKLFVCSLYFFHFLCASHPHPSGVRKKLLSGLENKATVTCLEENHLCEHK